MRPYLEARETRKVMDLTTVLHLVSMLLLATLVTGFLLIAKTVFA